MMKKALASFMLSYLFFSVAYAQVSADTASIKRLFTTADERQKLEKSRIPKPEKKTLSSAKVRRQQASRSTDAPASYRSASKKSLAKISIQGYVKRHDGEASTIWINQKPAQEGERIQGVLLGLQPSSPQPFLVELRQNQGTSSTRLPMPQDIDPSVKFEKTP